MFFIASTENKAHARLINKWRSLVVKLKTSGGSGLQTGLSGLWIHCFSSNRASGGFPHASGMVALGSQGHTLAVSYARNESVLISNC